MPRANMETRFLLLLILIVVTVVHATEDPEDEDFPDDEGASSSSKDFRGPTQSGQSAKPPSPISVYVIRLLEILLGVENINRGTSRVTRAARQNMFIDGAFPPTDSSPTPLSSADAGRNTGASYSNYYDFLINEGSYKFWAFFQLATAALMVYSAFAALYYARYTYYTSVDYSDYDDYFFRRSGRMTRSLPGLPPPPPSQAPFAGLNPVIYRTIMDAVSGEHNKTRATS